MLVSSTLSLPNLRNNLFYFIFNIVYIAERDTHPCGSPISMGKVEVWKNVGGTNISFFFSAVSSRREGERESLLAVKLYQHLEMGHGHLMIP